MNEYERKASVLPKNLESSEGSNGVPELKLITSGTRAGSSLNFYLQIGNSVYKYLVYQAATTPEKIMLNFYKLIDVQNRGSKSCRNSCPNAEIGAVNLAKNTAPSQNCQHGRSFLSHFILDLTSDSDSASNSTHESIFTLKTVISNFRALEKCT
jgi:hypothetical protein